MFSEDINNSTNQFLSFAQSYADAYRVPNPHDYMVSTVNGCFTTEAIRNGWDRVAPIWPSIESRNNYQASMKTLLEYLREPERNEKWISLGSGPAIYEMWLNRMFNVHICATDLSPEMIRLAKNIFSGLIIRNLPMDFAPMSMTSIDYPSSNFDRVLSLNALQWVPEWRKAIEEMSRVAKDNAFLYLIYSIEARTGEDQFGFKHPVSDISIHGLFDELEKNRFNILATRQLLIRKGQLGGYANRLFIFAKKTDREFTSWQKCRPTHTTLCI